MFDIEKYINVKHAYLKRNNDGRFAAHINIDDDEINKEIKEFYESLRNLHKILGYDFTLTVNENDIIFEELKQ